MSGISFKRDASFDKCPKCKSVGKLRRSRAQSPFEQGVKKLGIVNYYRCKECEWRGSRLNVGMSKITYKTVLLYLFLMLATALIVRFIIEKFAMK